MDFENDLSWSVEYAKEYIPELEAKLVQCQRLLKEWLNTPFFETEQEWLEWVSEFRPRVEKALARGDQPPGDCEGVMNKHTPGVWDFRHYKDDEGKAEARVFVEDTDKIIAALFCRHYWIQLTNEEIIANARLIAAAPDLLAALERALWELTLPTFPTKNEHFDTLNIIRAAITKARGDEPPVIESE